MSLFVIVIVICFIVGFSSSIRAKISRYERRVTAKGSIAIELEEFEKWSKQLYYEYKELTRYDMEYPNFEIDKSNTLAVEKSYYNAFSHVHCLYKPREYGASHERYLVWNNKRVIEQLRIKYNLPSNEELYLKDLGLSLFKNVKKIDRYKCLANVVSKCVQRAVHTRGFKYQGEDYLREETMYLKAKEISETYSWTTNDPTNKQLEQKNEQTKKKIN